MALALRLRRVLAAASSTSAPLLRSGGISPSSSSAARSLPLAPLVRPLPLPLPLPWAHLPGAAAGFRSTAAAAARDGGYGGGRDDNKINPDEILFEGCDYNHWLITMEFPDPKPSREEMIETYLQTLAKVVGSYEEAKKRMYALSTTTYIGFQAVMTEEMSEKFRGLPGVVFILPDSYLYPETKEYGGDKYENGVITPRPPPVHYSKPSRTDRNRDFRGNYDRSSPRWNYQDNYQNRPPQQSNYQNRPPQQNNYPNSPPQQGNYQNSPPQQGNFQTQRPPQQNYAQDAQGGTGYGRNDYAHNSGSTGTPGGYQGPSPQYQEQQAGQGQGYYNPQERRNLSQGQPAAPGTYGQPPAPGNYGQPPAPGNYGQPPAPGNYGQPPAPTYPGGDQQGNSAQSRSPSEGQEENWQARQ